MDEKNSTYQRVAVITEIARRSPNIGRTALMKYLYLLQSVKRIDLGYSFRLYSYGPFDSAVLSDISTSVSWGGAKQTVCHYPSGVGYELSEGENSEAVLATSKEFLAEADSSIAWVVEQFRGCGAGDMELMATMVYVDQELLAAKESLTSEQLIKRALEIKPRYSEEQALARLAKLVEANALKSTVVA